MNMKQLVEDNLTLITPVRIFNDLHYQELECTLKSYYERYDFRPLHKFSTKINPIFQKKFVNLLEQLNCNYEITNTNETALHAFVSLYNSVETKCSFMVFSDVENLSQKDIIGISLKALEENEKLIQVRLSGYPMGDYGLPRNTSHFIIEDGKLKFELDKSYVFEPYDVTENDTVWISPLIPERLDKFFALPFWHTIMKTNIAKRFIESTMPYLQPNDSTISSFIKYGHTSDTILRSTLREDGWPDGFEWISEYDHGFLNMSCYLYMLGRDRKSRSEFTRDHGNEINSKVLENPDLLKEMQP